MAPIELVLLQHRHAEHGPRAASSTMATSTGSRLIGRDQLLNIQDMDNSFLVRASAAEPVSRPGVNGLLLKNSPEFRCEQCNIACRDAIGAVPYAQTDVCRTWPRRCASRSPAWP